MAALSGCQMRARGLKQVYYCTGRHSSMPGLVVCAFVLMAGSRLSSFVGHYRPATATAAHPSPLRPLRGQRVAVAAEEEDDTDVWREVLAAERARSELLLDQLEESKAAIAGTPLEMEVESARALWEECAVTWGASEYESLKACNEGLQRGIERLRSGQSLDGAPGPATESGSGRLDGIGVVVEVMRPVTQSDDLALIPGAPHVRISLPLGMRGLMWGSDLTPLFDEEGARLMAFMEDAPFYLELEAAPRPVQAPEGSGDVIVVKSVGQSSQAERTGIRPGDYVRAVSYMSPGEEPDFLNSMLGATRVPVPAILKCDGLTVDQVIAAMETNIKSAEGSVTLLLERPL